VKKWPWAAAEKIGGKLKTAGCSYSTSKGYRKKFEYASAVNPATGTIRNVKYGQKLVENVVVVGTGSICLKPAVQRSRLDFLYAVRGRWRTSGVCGWF